MTPVDLAALRDQLVRHEGLRLKPYRDTVGKLTIGVGRNLDDVGISQDEALTLLGHDMQAVVAALEHQYPWFATLDGVRQRVLADMAFNLGLAALAQFTHTLAAIERQDYAAAADQMLQSRWAGQVGSRAVTLAAMMRTGTV